MTAITIADLTNAKTDVDHIADIATSVALTATDRIGHIKDTLTGAMYKVSAFNSRGAWVTATTYAIKDLVSNAGTWYVCVVAHTSSAAFSTDTATKWRVYQGVILGDLAASSGSSLVGHLPTGVGATATTVQDALRFLQTQFIDVTAAPYYADKTGAVEATAIFLSALSAGRNVYAPAGTYKLNALALASNAAIYGDGMRRTIFIPAAGATSVILVDATTTAKQNVTLENLCLKNPNNVAGCNALEFKGVDVNDINDQHNLKNIEIGPVGWEGTTYKFAIGIKTTGRLISLTATNVINSGNTINWHSATDPSTPAFNGHVFTNCVSQLAEAQGWLHTGRASNVKFIGGYTQQNNSLNVAGVAGMDVSDTFNWDLDNHGFEANGSGVVVDAANPLNNSISFLHRGTICQELSIKGGYFTSSGANIVIGPTVTGVVGGKIENNFLNTLAGGFNFATLAPAGSNTAAKPMVFSHTNYCSDKVSIYTAGVGVNAVVEQNNGMGYLTATVTDIDLLKTSTFTCNPAAPFTISAVANMIPGCTLTILNNIYGASTVKIAGALMQSGTDASVLTGTVGVFRVQASPVPGVFVRIQ